MNFKNFYTYQIIPTIFKIIISLPSHPRTDKTKGKLLKPFFKDFGENNRIERGCKFYHPLGITIGDNVYIGDGVSIYANGDKINSVVSIGDNTLIAHNTTIHVANHIFKDTTAPIITQGVTPTNIKIGEGCWIGSHVIILPDVNIGEGCVVGAGSIVTKNLPAYSVCAGNPAKVSKYRK